MSYASYPPTLHAPTCTYILELHSLMGAAILYTPQLLARSATTPCSTPRGNCFSCLCGPNDEYVDTPLYNLVIDIHERVGIAHASLGGCTSAADAKLTLYPRVQSDQRFHYRERRA